MNLNYILKKPIITEKSLSATKDNRYTFQVDTHATKFEIKTALKQIFNVDAIKIWTSLKKPTSITSGKRRTKSQSSLTKKAVVELKAGQTIKVFETKG